MQSDNEVVSGSRLGMYGCTARLIARPGCKEELLAFLKCDADVSRRQEPGTLRLDFWQDPDQDNSVIL